MKTANSIPTEKNFKQKKAHALDTISKPDFSEGLFKTDNEKITLSHINEITLSYSGSLQSGILPSITSSQSAAELAYSHWNQNTIALYESFKIILLNNSNKVKGIYEVSKGGITGTLVDIRIVFAVLLKSLATAVILLHNHPSGTLKPSEADKRLTQKIKTAAEVFDIKLLDHLILVPDGQYFSFVDSGIL